MNKKYDGVISILRDICLTSGFIGLVFVLFNSQQVIGIYSETNNITLPFQGALILLLPVLAVFSGLGPLMILNKILRTVLGIEKKEQNLPN